MSNKINYVLFRKFHSRSLDTTTNDVKKLTIGEFNDLFRVVLDIYQSDSCHESRSELRHECFKCSQNLCSNIDYIKFFKLTFDTLMNFLLISLTEHEINILINSLIKPTHEFDYTKHSETQKTLMMYVIFKNLEHDIKKSNNVINESLDLLFKNFEKCYLFFKSFPCFSENSSTLLVDLISYIETKKFLAKHLIHLCKKNKCFFVSVKSYWSILCANFESYCTTNSPNLNRLQIFLDINNSISNYQAIKKNYAYHNEKNKLIVIDKINEYNEDFNIENTNDDTPLAQLNKRFKYF
jgi:hypothetical protein